jgi:hypothetical protein
MMEKFKSLPANVLLFDLGARLGSLEGYLYAGDRVDIKYLPNWLVNVAAAYVVLLRGMLGDSR